MLVSSVGEERKDIDMNQLEDGTVFEQHGSEVLVKRKPLFVITRSIHLHFYYHHINKSLKQKNKKMKKRF